MKVYSINIDIPVEQISAFLLWLKFIFILYAPIPTPSEETSLMAPLRYVIVTPFQANVIIIL